MHICKIIYTLASKYFNMGLFDGILKGKNSNKTNSFRCTTEGFYIGAAEAECEANNPRTPLTDVFEDYLDVMTQINNEAFIVTGRKGSGKTAIGEYMYSIAEDNANLFATFIKKTDVDIEKIVHLGLETGNVIQQELLFKWIILTQLVKLIVKNQNVSKFKEVESLNKFLSRNRGFVDIKNNEVKEVLKERGTKVNLEHLKRFYSANFQKKIAIKEEKAEFYKLIPYLEEIILNILQKDPDNNYILIFDDLDVGYSSKLNSNVSTLSELIRIAKYFNNEFFKRNSLDSKVIILLRNDIVKHLIYSADTAKMFASYSIELKWYEDEFRYQEDSLKLKQFVVKRIVENFKRLNIVYNIKNPFGSFVDETEYRARSGNTSKTCFKYIIEHTFFRPRDLILLFSDIDRYKFELPISRSNIKTLIGKYANLMMLELQNELSVSYSPSEIQRIFAVLKAFNEKNFSYITLRTNLQNTGFTENADAVIEDLFDYSLIGNISDENDITFKFREKGAELCKFNPEKRIILHKVLVVYFRSNQR